MRPARAPAREASVAIGRARRPWLFALAFLALGGCAVSDEGATDFRLARPQDQRAAWVKLQPAEAADLPIGEGEIVQIVLETAFVSDFWSLFGHPAVSGGKANGEIAIVVSAFEDDGKTPDRFGADALANARVVYFNEDVVEGQFLNFGPGLPIRGPAEHRGFPLRLDLWIVELDQPGDQARRLLSVLAALGGTALPPAAPIAAPLARLAGTLITDRQDDPAFHYTLTPGRGRKGRARGRAARARRHRARAPEAARPRHRLEGPALPRALGPAGPRSARMPGERAAAGLLLTRADLPRAAGLARRPAARGAAGAARLRGAAPPVRGREPRRS